MPKIIEAAIADVRAGVGLSRVWIALANEDIGDQHRRTTLGPIWLLINYLIYIGTFLAIFGEHLPIPDFAAYVALGLLIFLYMQEIVIQSVSLYSKEESLIAGTALPLSVYVLRLAMQSLIRTGYAALGCVVILLLAHTPITIYWLWSLVGIALIVLITPAVIIVLATAGAIFPDLQFVASNLIRVAMFFTPIFWLQTDGVRSQIYLFNPLTHFLEIVRKPIIDAEVPLLSFAVCLLIGAIFWAAAIIPLGVFRKKIVFLL